MKAEEIQEFVHEHIQQEINAGTLFDKGISHENFEHDINLYSLALFEGIVNGIIMMNGEIEGIKFKTE